MPKIAIKTAEPEGEVGTTLLKQFDELIHNVRRRAYELFEQRGRQNGSDLDDWFRAEEELVFPAKITVEEAPGNYNLQISTPGFTGKDLRVYTLGDRLIVSGDVEEKSSNRQGKSTEERRSVFCQWPLPPGAQVDSMTAEAGQDALTIKIPIEAKPKTVQAASGAASTEQKGASTAA